MPTWWINPVSRKSTKRGGGGGSLQPGGESAAGGGVCRNVVPWQQCSLMVRWVVGSILHGGPIELFWFQSVLRVWYNISFLPFLTVCIRFNLSDKNVLAVFICLNDLIYKCEGHTHCTRHLPAGYAHHSRTPDIATTTVI